MSVGNDDALLGFGWGSALYERFSEKFLRNGKMTTEHVKKISSSCFLWHSRNVEVSLVEMNTDCSRKKGVWGKIGGLLIATRIFVFCKESSLLFISRYPPVFTAICVDYVLSTAINLIFLHHFPSKFVKNCKQSFKMQPHISTNHPSFVIICNTIDACLMITLKAILSAILS